MWYIFCHYRSNINQPNQCLNSSDWHFREGVKSNLIADQQFFVFYFFFAQLIRLPIVNICLRRQHVTYNCDPAHSLNSAFVYVQMYIYVKMNDAYQKSENEKISIQPME